MRQYREVKDMIGATMASVVNNGNDELIFNAQDGRAWRMYHYQDCRESVSIDDIVGDLEDLVGVEMLEAYEADSGDAGPQGEYRPDSYTWTFYRFRTIKGTVTVKWYGESNGYYSESVDFIQIT